MSIKTITTDDLRRMKGQEGLILQGCGGDPQEWLDGINDLLTKEGILLNGSKFENCSVFKYDDLTCILYPFEGAELNIGKFAVWRLATHDNFGGTSFRTTFPTDSGASREKSPMRTATKIWTKGLVCANDTENRIQMADLAPFPRMVYARGYHLPSRSHL